MRSSSLKALRSLLLATLFAGAMAGCGGSSAPAGDAAATGAVELLNVSYDPTREFYREFDDSFAREWKAKTGQTVTVNFADDGTCGYTFRAVFDDGDETIVDVDVCSVQSVTIN